MLSLTTTTSSAKDAAKPTPRHTRTKTPVPLAGAPGSGDREADYNTAAIPKEFTDLGGKKWEIKLEAMPDYAGYTDYTHHQVFIDPDIRDPQETLFHELMHVVSGPSNRPNHPANVHGFIYVFSPRMTHLFQQNPQLVEYLFKK